MQWRTSSSNKVSAGTELMGKNTSQEEEFCLLLPVSVSMALIEVEEVSSA